MSVLEPAIEATLAMPECVMQSLSDEQVRFYLSFLHGYEGERKQLCVVVKVLPDDAFVITAYLTDKVKKGVQLWSTKP